MSQPLIFTEQRVWPRVIDVLLTILAWGAFLHLIYNGLILALMQSTYIGIRPFFSTLDTVTLYFCIALINGLLLIGWAKYNQFRFSVERRKRRFGCNDQELAESLHMAPSLVMAMSQGRRLTVYHHENGYISYVVIESYLVDDRLLQPQPLMLEILSPIRVLAAVPMQEQQEQEQEQELV